MGFFGSKPKEEWQPLGANSGLSDYIQREFMPDRPVLNGMSYTHNDGRVKVRDASGRVVYEGTEQNGTYRLKGK